jgi:hypothetical protein
VKLCHSSIYFSSGRSGKAVAGAYAEASETEADTRISSYGEFAKGSPCPRSSLSDGCEYRSEDTCGPILPPRCLPCLSYRTTWVDRRLSDLIRFRSIIFCCFRSRTWEPLGERSMTSADSVLSHRPGCIQPTLVYQHCSLSFFWLRARKRRVTQPIICTGARLHRSCWSGPSELTRGPEFTIASFPLPDARDQPGHGSQRV